MKKLLVTCLFSLLFIGAFAEISTTEKRALLDLYTTTNGENWTHSWDTSEPVTNWYGVTIENDKVVGLSLLFNNIKGSLPASIGDLKNLRVLELSFNMISGPLPETLGNLVNLEVLAFNGNNISGVIPSSIENLTLLRQLHLSSNHLNGTIPESIGNLEQLEVFNVFDNNLIGELPIGLASNSNLRELMVAENNLEFTPSFSKILLSNSGSNLNLNETNNITPAAKNIIAIESSDDEN